jgi:membrane protein CcdC involved in cytochrome C biogenesis
MTMQVHAAAPWLQYVVPFVIVAAVIGLRLLRMRGTRRLRLETLWILPALYGAGVVAMFAWRPPSGNGCAIAAAALLVGVAIGWYRGTMMAIAVDPETHALSQRASPAAIILLFGLLVLRRIAMAEFVGPGFNVMLVTDVLLALALGLIAATRIEMALRARRLLAQARALRPSRTFG